jgi:hypothetical protein
MCTLKDLHKQTEVLLEVCKIGKKALVNMPGDKIWTLIGPNFIGFSSWSAYNKYWLQGDICVKIRHLG